MSKANPDTCLSCDDSGLSTTGNVTGILTFAYALAIGYFWYYNGLRNATVEMDEMWERLEARYHDAVFLRDRISTARRDHQAGTAELSSSDKVRLDRASDRVVRPLEEALKMLTLATPDTRDGVFGKSRWLAAGRFMVRKAQLIDMTERTEKALAELRDVASEVLGIPDLMGINIRSMLRKMSEMQQQQVEHDMILKSILASVSQQDKSKSRRLSL